MEAKKLNIWNSLPNEKKYFHNHGVKKNKSSRQPKRENFASNLSMIIGTKKGKKIKKKKLIEI